MTKCVFSHTQCHIYTFRSFIPLTPKQELVIDYTISFVYHSIYQVFTTLRMNDLLLLNLGKISNQHVYRVIKTCFSYDRVPVGNCVIFAII